MASDFSGQSCSVISITTAHFNINFNIMRRILYLFLVSIFSLSCLQVAVAQNSATQDVTINVAEITVFALDGSGAVTFNFSSSDATAGSTPASLTETRSYSLFTNVPNGGSNSGAKITGELGADFNSGITLKSNLTAPSAGGSSQNAQALSTTATDLVKSIPPTAEGNVNIEYTAEITPSAAPNSGTTETVTYTLTAQ